jgi:hypothetical protein
MTFPTSRQGDSAESVAESVDGVLSRAVDQLEAFRIRVNSGTIISAEAQAIYAELTGARVYVEARKSVNGLAESYARRFPALVSFNPGVEWATVRVRLDSLITWFVTNLPKDAAGRPVFLRFKAVTQELEPCDIALSVPVRTALLAEIDATLATFD